MIPPTASSHRPLADMARTRVDAAILRAPIRFRKVAQRDSGMERDGNLEIVLWGSDMI